MKNAIIFGDSYSTFKGYVPEGYICYYSENRRPETDVTRVEETWWYQVVKEAGLNLIMNNSWSGSPICYTGYDNADCSETSSFICRFKKLKDEGFFEKNRVDTVFIFGGTNDNWCGAQLGEAKWENIEKEDLYSVLPAVYLFLRLVRETLPEAEIYCLINTELKDELTEALLNASERNGITPIRFKEIDKNCGHPTIKGMKDIKSAVLEVMDK